MNMPDFVAMRQRLAEHPDDMVHDIAEALWSTLAEERPAAADDFVWLFESYERRKPKVHRRTVTENTPVREGFG